MIKKIFTGLLMLTSISAFADDSIRLTMTDGTGFGTDQYSIPSRGGETAAESLLILANALAQDACYTGNAVAVKAILDKTANSAKNVKSYSSFVSRNTLSIDLTVYNQNIRSKQRNQIVIKQCKSLN